MTKKVKVSYLHFQEAEGRYGDRFWP